MEAGCTFLGLLSPRLLSSAFLYGVNLDLCEGWDWPIILCSCRHMFRSVGKGRIGFIKKRGYGCAVISNWLPLPPPA